MPGDVEPEGEPALPRGDTRHAEGGQPAERDGEQENSHEPDPEDRRCVEDEAEHSHERVAETSRPRRRDGAEGDSGYERKDVGSNGQEQGRWQPLDDHVQDRALHAVGVTEIQSGNVGHVDPELLRDRTIEAEGLAKLCYINL